MEDVVVNCIYELCNCMLLKHAEPHAKDFTIGEEQSFEDGINITIHLQWNESVLNGLFYYVVSVVPNKLREKPLDIKVMVPYNVLYNVSVIAMPRCGYQQNSTLLHIGLFYCK